MPPKADQNKAAAKPAAKAGALTLPDFPMASTNGQQPMQDNTTLDQDPADGLAAAMGLFSNDMDADDDQQDFQQLYAVLQNVIKSKENKKQKKAQAIVQELQSAITTEVEAVTSAVTKEQRDMTGLLNTTLNTGKKKLNDKFKVIEDITAKYQQDLAAAWQEYSTLYTRLEETKSKTAVQLEKVRAAHKRKFAELQSSLQQKVAEAESRVAKLTSKGDKSEKMNQLMKMFASS